MNSNAVHGPGSHVAMPATPASLLRKSSSPTQRREADSPVAASEPPHKAQALPNEEDLAKDAARAAAMTDSVPGALLSTQE